MQGQSKVKIWEPKNGVDNFDAEFRPDYDLRG